MSPTRNRMVFFLVEARKEVGENGPFIQHGTALVGQEKDSIQRHCCVEPVNRSFQHYLKLEQPLREETDEFSTHDDNDEQ